jgi:hypothetical protein
VISCATRRPTLLSVVRRTADKMFAICKRVSAKTGYPFDLMARPEGLEPATNWFVVLKINPHNQLFFLIVFLNLFVQ